MIENRNFHQTQLPGYAANAAAILMASKPFLYKNVPKSLAAGAPPQTLLEAQTAFYSLLERMEMRGKINLSPISWLRHCGKFKSHQKFPC